MVAGARGEPKRASHRTVADKNRQAPAGAIELRGKRRQPGSPPPLPGLLPFIVGFPVAWSPRLPSPPASLRTPLRGIFAPGKGLANKGRMTTTFIHTRRLRSLDSSSDSSSDHWMTSFLHLPSSTSSVSVRGDGGEGSGKQIPGNCRPGKMKNLRKFHHILAAGASMLVFAVGGNALKAQSAREAIATFQHDGSNDGLGITYGLGPDGPEVIGDGKQLLTWYGNTVKISPITGGNAIATFQHKHRVFGAKVISDGERLLTWNDAGLVKIWPIAGGEAITTFQQNDIRGVKVIDDGKQLLTWSDVGEVLISPINGGMVTVSFHHDDSEDSLDVGATVINGGKQLLTWGDDLTAKIWLISGGKAVATFRHDTAILGPKVIGGGRQLLTWMAEDGIVEISPIGGGKPTVTFENKTFKEEDFFLLDAEVINEGKNLLAVNMMGTVKIWPITGGEAITTIKVEGGLAGAKVIGGGEQLLTLGYGGTVQIWPISGGEAIASFKHKDIVGGAEVINEGKQLLTWSRDSTVKIWPITGGGAIATFHHEGPLYGAKVINGGKQLLTWSRDKIAKVWDISDIQ